MFFSNSEINQSTKCAKRNIQTHKNHYVYLLWEKIRLSMQHKLQYTFGVKFSVFGYSDPNIGINQLEPAHDTRCFIVDKTVLWI